jgi:hypothetical protein
MSHHRLTFGTAIAVLECNYLQIMSLQLHGTLTFLNRYHVYQQKLSSEVGSDSAFVQKKAWKQQVGRQGAGDTRQYFIKCSRLSSYECAKASIDI